MIDADYGVLKWIVIPFILIVIAFVLFDSKKNTDECREACISQGFHDSRFIPRNARAANYKDKCYCLTEEEAQIKNRVVRGTRVY